MKKYSSDESLWDTLRKVHLPPEALLFVIVSVGDILMTWKLLNRGGFYESNGLARWFLNHWGMKGMIYFKMAMCAFVIVLSQIIARYDKDKSLWVLRTGVIIVGVVILYSFMLYARSAW